MADKMTPQEFTDALDTLGLSPTAFAKLIGSNDKNMRRAAEPDSDGPGPAASHALRLMVAMHWAIAEMEDRCATLADPETIEGSIYRHINRAIDGEFE